LIGTALEASVLIETPDRDTADFLASFGETLHFLFITSDVLFGQASEGAFRSEAIPGLAIEVRKAEGEKCERCWNYTSDTGSSPEWPGICARCAAHVAQIQAAAEQA
jgi:isoleucyl-tRNA synthetase